MNYEKDGNKFSIPDRPTVRQQMRYFSTVQWADNPQRMELHWEAARELITEWYSERLPVLEEIDIDALSDPSDLNVLVWAGAQVAVYMTRLEDVPKN